MRFPRAPMQYFYPFQRRRLWCQLAMTSSGRDALMGAGIFPWAVDSSDFLTGPFQLLESETAFKGQKREEKKYSITQKMDVYFKIMSFQLSLGLTQTLPFPPCVNSFPKEDASQHCCVQTLLGLGYILAVPWQGRKVLGG